MVYMNDFLSELHKTRFGCSDVSKCRGVNKVLFRLSFESSLGKKRLSVALVSVVDEKGKLIVPDYKQYQGETFNVLRMMEGIR